MSDAQELVNWMRTILDPTPVLATLFMLLLGYQISLTPAIIPAAPELCIPKPNDQKE